VQLERRVTNGLPNGRAGRDPQLVATERTANASRRTSISGRPALADREAEFLDQARSRVSRAEEIRKDAKTVGHFPSECGWI
jgi:hypothetical protein